MSIRRALTLVVAILWLWPASLHAQSEALLEALRQGKAFYEAGQYDRAIPFFRKALELGEEEFGSNHPTTANLLGWLASTYKYQSRYADAEPLYKRSLAILEKALGPDHPDVATSLNNLAALYDDQGRYADAEPLYKRSLAIREKVLGAEHPDVATSRSAIADRDPAHVRSLPERSFRLEFEPVVGQYA